MNSRQSRRAGPLPAAFFKGNRRRLVEKLPEGALAVIFGNKAIAHNGDSVFPFKQNTSFYYLTGLLEEDGVLLLRRGSSEGAEELLCIREASEVERIWTGGSLSTEQAMAISGVATIKPRGEFERCYHKWAVDSEVLYFLLDEHRRGAVEPQVTSNNYQNFIKLRERYPLHRYGRLGAWVNELRMVKQPEELAMIEQAIALTVRMIKAMLPLVRKGDVWEYELEAELLRELMLGGGAGFAFEPILAGGKRSCVLHYTQNDGWVEAGSRLLLDIGASFGEYHADLTRVLPAGGRFSRRAGEIYDAVHCVHDEVLAMMRPGLLFTDYQAGVRTIMGRELGKLGLISVRDEKEKTKEENKQYEKYFMHGISHFLGLEVHDVGEMRGVFRENMVLTLEPGIYVQEEGIGVRLENNILITADGARNLSEKLPIERTAVEDWVAKD